MATGWGKVINNIGFGTIYNESWVGQYPFVSIVGDANDLYKRVSDASGTMVSIVGDANDLYKRVSDASGTMEAQECLVETFNKSVKQ
jgi:hypothetical protein